MQEVERLMAKDDFSKCEVRPDPEVMNELERMHAPVEKMVAQAVRFIDGSEEQDLAVERFFLDKGYSSGTAGWIVREANTRRAADLRSKTSASES